MSIVITGAKVKSTPMENGVEIRIWGTHGDIDCNDDLMEKIQTGYYDNYDNDIELRIPDGCQTISLTKQEEYKAIAVELLEEVKMLRSMCVDEIGGSILSGQYNKELNALVAKAEKTLKTP